jgi:hypothetical protein
MTVFRHALTVPGIAGVQGMPAGFLSESSACATAIQNPSAHRGPRLSSFVTARGHRERCRDTLSVKKIPQRSVTW